MRTLTHLDRLEAESIHVMREVAAEFERPGLLFSGGKDSIVMLHLAQKAFWPARIPFPLVHVDTGHNFDEVLAINAECGQSVWDSLLPVDPSIEAYKGMDVTLMDLTAAVCREDWCPSIIGNMAVYRDAHHFNNIFAETLAPEIEAQMFDPNHKIPPMNAGLMPKNSQPAPPNPQN